MSPLFRRHFNRQNICTVCPRPTNGHTVCKHHLALARDWWFVWSYARQQAGRCSYCHRRAVRIGGHLGIRCRLHRHENQVRAAAWRTANPTAQDQAYKVRKKILAGRRCPQCAEHRPLPAGFNRCDWCRTYRQARKNGRPTVGRLMQEQKEIRDALRRARFQELAAGLPAEAQGRLRKVLP